MNMSERDKRTLKIGAAVVAAAVLLRFAVLPVFDTWMDARAKVKSYRAQLTSMSGLLDQHAITQMMLRQKYGDAVDQPLLDEEQTRVVFPQAVQAALRDGGMNVQRVDVPSVRRLRDVPNVSMVTVRVEGTTGGEQVSKVLASLRSCERLTLIDRFETSMAQPGNRQQWKVRLTLSTPALQSVTGTSPGAPAARPPAGLSASATPGALP